MLRFVISGVLPVCPGGFVDRLLPSDVLLCYHPVGGHQANGGNRVFVCVFVCVHGLHSRCVCMCVIYGGGLCVCKCVRMHALHFMMYVCVYVCALRWCVCAWIFAVLSYVSYMFLMCMHFVHFCNKREVEKSVCRARCILTWFFTWVSASWRTCIGSLRVCSKPRSRQPAPSPSNPSSCARSPRRPPRPPHPPTHPLPPPPPLPPAPTGMPGNPRPKSTAPGRLRGWTWLSTRRCRHPLHPPAKGTSSRKCLGACAFSTFGLGRDSSRGLSW